MIWLLVILGVLVTIAIALGAVGSVTRQLESTVRPALLQVDDAVDAVAEAIPFEVSAEVSHEDVDQIIRWVLDWFAEIGLSSEYGEELGGEWVTDERVVADEVGASDHVVARALHERPDLSSVYVTVIVDAFLVWLRDIGAVGDVVD